MRLTLIAAALALSVGCSWIAMKGPPEGPVSAGRPPACTSSRLAPVIDLLSAPMAGFLVGIVAWAAAGGDVLGESDGGAAPTGLAAGMITGGVLVAASISGFGKARGCRKAVADYYTAIGPGAARPPAATPAAREPPISAGHERGPCHADGGCEPGLTCASRRCVRLPPPR
jgi:hypothetical protein